MLCSHARTAISAGLDGEAGPPCVSADALRDHLAGCQDCRRWEAGARSLQHAVAEAVRRGTA